MKTAERPRGLHQIALVALFTLGNTILRFPWANAQAGVSVSFLISAAVALLFGLGSCFGAAWFYRRWMNGKKPCRVWLGVLISLPVCVLALICAVRGSRDLISFLGKTLLPQGTGLIFAALFLAVAAWLSRIERRGLDVFALTAFFFVLVAVLALFLLGVPQFRTEYGKIEWPGISAIGASVLPVFSEFALPILPLGVYLALAKPERKKRRSLKPLAFGILAGGAVMLLCVLQTLLTFGAPYAASLEYPYSAAVRVVSLGAYAFRPELLSYLPDFLSCLIRVCVCFSCLKFTVGRFLPRLRNAVPPLAALIVFVLLCLL